jgi:hypothetical protein
MEKVWQYFLMLVISTLLGVSVLHITSTKRIIEYHLSGEYSQGVPRIRVNIDNSPDEVIQLSPDITWDQAIIMVDSLNINLKKNSIR